MNLQRMRYHSGFTLVEMLGVIFIIATLLGILFPTIAKVRYKAKVVKAQAEIEALAVSIRMYESDLGKYPPSTVSGSEIYDFLGKKIHSGALNIDVGPYMEFKSTNLGPGNIYKDPWGNAYIYAGKDGGVGTPPPPVATHNTFSFDIHSTGPDGSQGTTADDVNNW